MNSLHQRLVASAAIVLLLFVVITAWVLQRADYERLIDATHSRLQGIVYGVLGAAELNPDASIFVDQNSLPDARLIQSDSGLYVVIENAGGVRLWQSTSILEPLPGLVTPGIGEWIFSTEGGYLVASLGVRWYLGDDVYRLTVRAYESSMQLDQSQTAFTRTLLLWLSGLSLLLLLMLYLVLRWAASPIDKLGESVDKVRSGEFREIEASMPQELETVKLAINRLLEHERARHERYRNSLDDLAHSLKTPLSVLRNDAFAQHDEETLHELGRIEEILTYHLSRVASSNTPAFSSMQPLTEIISRIGHSLLRVYQDKGIRFEIQADDEIHVRVDKKMLFEILGNLLDNAFKWATSAVSVVCTKADDMNRIVFQDDGPGFEASNPAIYLQRGVRADERVAGQGIGLAAANLLVIEAGGELRLRNREQGGAEVTLDLPGPASI